MALDPEDKLRLPVLNAGAEYLVMAWLMRRNILVYKAPQNYEGYDLIAVHPNPRREPATGERAQVTIQVKSRYQSDSNRTVLLKSKSLDAFDFLAVVFWNIGRFYGKYDGSEGSLEPEIYVMPRSFVQKHHAAGQKMEKLSLKHLTKELSPYSGMAGVELVANALGVARPLRAARARARGSA